MHIFFEADDEYILLCYRRMKEGEKMQLGTGCIICCGELLSLARNLI